MDKYSFLNAAHTGYFAQMYDQYLQQPDSVEASWRAFFQGFDFGVENSQESFDSEIISEVPEHLQKEFQAKKTKC